MSNNLNKKQSVQNNDATKEERYSGANALRLNEKYTFGPEAVKYLTDIKYQHLSKQGKAKFTLSLTDEHPHAYLAFVRKHLNQIIVRGLGFKEHFHEIGGHLNRNFTSTTHDPITKNEIPWVNFIHSCNPILDQQDEARHMNWARMLGTSFDKGTLNYCNYKVENQLCDCVDPMTNLKWRDQSSFLSIDSAYYPGVLLSIENELLRTTRNDREKGLVTPKYGYCTFHDYAQAIRSKILSYNTFDNESTTNIELVEGSYQVNSSVHGNSHSYQHAVIATGKNDSWGRIREVNGKKYTILYNVRNRLSTGKHDYILVEMCCLTGVDKGLEYVSDYFLKKEEEDFSKPLDNILFEDEFVNVGALSGMATNLASNILSFLNNIRLRCKEYVTVQKAVIVENKFVKLTLVRTIKNQKKIEVLEVDPTEYASAYQTLFGTIGSPNALIRTMKSLLSEAKNKNSNSVDFTRQKNAIILANINTNIDLRDLCDVTNTSDEVFFAKESVNGKSYKERPFAGLFGKLFQQHEANPLGYSRIYPFIQEWISEFSHCWKLMFVPLFIAIVMIALSFFPQVQAANGEITSKESCAFLVVCLLLPIVLPTLKVMANRVFKRSIKFGSLKCSDKRHWLKGTCVLDPARLDISTTLHREVNWKFRNPDWNILGLTGQQAYDKLPCIKEKTEAGQIGPLFKGSTFYIPTVKHACARTQMAAAIRQNQNKLTYEQAYMEVLLRNIRKSYKLIREGIKKDGFMLIDLDEWMQHYNMKYQDGVIKVLNGSEIIFDPKKMNKYDAFPKKELNVSDVPYELAQTIYNLIKERQICGPLMENKIAANAFCNKLEELADCYIPGVCLRKNWPQICSMIKTYENEIPDGIWFDGDISGMDTGISRIINECQNECKREILNMPEVIIDHRLTKEGIMLPFDEAAKTCIVSVNRGDVTYTNENRQSGQGWTSLDNSIVTDAIQETIRQFAGIPKSHFRSSSKGDDNIGRIARQYENIYRHWYFKVLAPKGTEGEYGVGMASKMCNLNTDLEELSFLSCKFIECYGHYRMVRIPHRVIQTLPWSLKVTPTLHNPEAMASSLLYSKGECLKAWAHGLPVFDKMADMCIRLGKQGQYTDYDKYKDLDRVWNDHDQYDYPAVLDWLWRQFGITEDEVIELEEMFDLCPDPLTTLFHPIFDKLYR